MGESEILLRTDNEVPLEWDAIPPLPLKKWVVFLFCPFVLVLGAAILKIKVNVNKKKKGEMFGTKAEGGEKESQLPPESEPTLAEDWSFQLTSGLPGPRCSNLWERRRARIFFVARVVACVRPSREAQKESLPGAFRASTAKTEAGRPRQASVLACPVTGPRLLPWK